ncbi:S8 family peptidase [Pseudomonas sp.]|uniref:S8 family peptidase n=2 Tax=Pseudomonas TaxID=286 RepID=UPI003BB0B9F1
MDELFRFDKEVVSMCRKMAYLILLSLAFSGVQAQAQVGLRIETLYRCGEWDAGASQQWCLQVRGMSAATPTLMFNGTVIPAASITRQGRTLQVGIDTRQNESGPIWLSDGKQFSNSVWLTVRGSHVLATDPNQQVSKTDGLVTSLELLNIIIREHVEGLPEAQHLADKFGMRIVGAIAPLNVYQMRISPRSLDERDALVSQLAKAPGVEAVVVEEGDLVRDQSDPDSNVIAPPDVDGGKANNDREAIRYYRQNVPMLVSAPGARPLRIGVVERGVDFDAEDFIDYLGPCQPQRTCVYARDTNNLKLHGSIVTGILAARWNHGGNAGFLRGLDQAGNGFHIIVDRDSNGGIPAKIAASVNMVEDGVRVLNWSWGVHRLGTMSIGGDAVISNVRSPAAFNGYATLLQRFFAWLQKHHPDVIVINSAGNSFSAIDIPGTRLPSSLHSSQLLEVGAHQRSGVSVKVSDAAYAQLRRSSNVGRRVDITAAACARVPLTSVRHDPPGLCGTSYATALVTGAVAAMISVNPVLKPEQIRRLLRQSALPLARQQWPGVTAIDFTLPLQPGERSDQTDPGIGQFARLNMYQALKLAVKSRDNPSAVRGQGVTLEPR